MFEAIGIVKSHGARTLFGPLDVRVNPGDRVALVGANGSGKTTLLRILAGEEGCDAGEIRAKKGLAIGYLPQEVEATQAGSLISFVENVSGELREVRSALAEAKEQMERGEGGDEAIRRFGVLQDRFEHLGGYRLRSEAMRILSGLGFGESDYARDLATFSGGWRMRALLARILLKDPDLVLLDEPTNHLDIVSLVWLEDFIRQSKSAFIIVSHDISFLDRLATSVMAITPGGALRVKGNYSEYVRVRAERMEAERASFERKSRAFAEERKLIDRFKAKNTKATQMQSRLKRLEKEEAQISAPVDYMASRPKFTFPQPERSGHEVVKFKNVTAGYGEKIIYRGLDFTLYRGRKIALIGPNGAGKSTFLKLMAGVLKPLSGEVVFGSNVTVSYFSQHQMELLSPKKTVLEEILTLPGLRTEREARTLLGSFLFSGDDVEKTVEILSGGEKSRLVLAKLMTSPGNLLLMDEPTNHLDIDSCEVLKTALAAFSGTLVVITHDRDLINRVADTVGYVEKASVTEFCGGYDDYLRYRAAENPAPAAQEPVQAGGGDATCQPAAKGKEARKNEAARRERFKAAVGPLKARVDLLEGKVDGAHKRLSEVEGELSNPEIHADAAKLAELSRERARVEESLHALMEEWEGAALEFEEASERFRLAEGAD